MHNKIECPYNLAPECITNARSLQYFPKDTEVYHKQMPGFCVYLLRISVGRVGRGGRWEERWSWWSILNLNE